MSIPSGRNVIGTPPGRRVPPASCSPPTWDSSYQSFSTGFPSMVRTRTSRRSFFSSASRARRSRAAWARLRTFPRRSRPFRVGPSRRPLLFDPDGLDEEGSRPDRRAERSDGAVPFPRERASCSESPCWSACVSWPFDRSSRCRPCCPPCDERPPPLFPVSRSFFRRARRRGSAGATSSPCSTVRRAASTSPVTYC